GEVVDPPSRRPRSGHTPRPPAAPARATPAGCPWGKVRSWGTPGPGQGSFRRKGDGKLLVGSGSYQVEIQRVGTPGDFPDQLAILAVVFPGYDLHGLLDRGADKRIGHQFPALLVTPDADPVFPSRQALLDHLVLAVLDHRAGVRPGSAFDGDELDVT